MIVVIKMHYVENRDVAEVSNLLLRRATAETSSVRSQKSSASSSNDSFILLKNGRKILRKKKRKCVKCKLPYIYTCTIPTCAESLLYR